MLSLEAGNLESKSVSHFPIEKPEDFVIQSSLNCKGTFSGSSGSAASAGVSTSVVAGASSGALASAAAGVGSAAGSSSGQAFPPSTFTVLHAHPLSAQQVAHDNLCLECSQDGPRMR